MIYIVMKIVGKLGWDIILFVFYNVMWKSFVLFYELKDEGKFWRCIS